MTRKAEPLSSASAGRSPASAASFAEVVSGMSSPTQAKKLLEAAAPVASKTSLAKPPIVKSPVAKVMERPMSLASPDERPDADDDVQDSTDDEFDLTQFKKIERPGSTNSQAKSSSVNAAAKTPPKSSAGTEASASLAKTSSAALEIDADMEEIDSGDDGELGALEAFRDAQSQSKRKSVEGFMQAMQGQFNVQPREIVQAFAKMDDESLSGSPEAAREKFLDGVGLQGSARAKAGALYDQMAQATGEAMRNEKIASQELIAAGADETTPAPSATARGQLTLLRMTEALEQGRPPASALALALAPVLNQSASKFSNEPKAEGQTSTASELASRMSPQKMASAQMTPVGTVANALANTQLSTLASALSAPVVSDTALQVKDLDAEVKNSGIDSGDLDDGKVESAEFSASQPSLVKSSDLGRIPPADMQPLSQAAQREAAKNAFSKAMKLDESTSGAAKKADVSARSSAQTGNASSSRVALDESALSPQAAPFAPAAAVTASAAKGIFATEGPKASAEETAANIQVIVRHAQTIAKNGGGEMRMELRPEGIGQLNLKVSVENGQVKVQMMTESADAKRLLEGSLHDLKLGLGAHKLQLETMRVDSNDGIQKQMEQQQRDAQRETARQFASDFMGGFREDREQFRQGFSDGRPARAYRGPQMMAAVEARSGESRSASSRRLNLVA